MVMNLKNRPDNHLGSVLSLPVFKHLCSLLIFFIKSRLCQNKILQIILNLCAVSLNDTQFHLLWGNTQVGNEKGQTRAQSGENLPIVNKIEHSTNGKKMVQDGRTQVLNSLSCNKHIK
jgi:hypothetical protein